MRDFMNIVEGQGTQLLYRWITNKQAMACLKRNAVPQGRWAHYLEATDAMTKGSSWSTDRNRWSSADSAETCLVIDATRVPNTIHSIAGNRTYLRTQGLINPDFDPSAWKHESEEPDEEFVEGVIRDLKAVTVRIETNSDTVMEIAEGLGIPVSDL